MPAPSRTGPDWTGSGTTGTATGCGVAAAASFALPSPASPSAAVSPTPASASVSAPASPEAASKWAAAIASRKSMPVQWHGLLDLVGLVGVADLLGRRGGIVLRTPWGSGSLGLVRRRRARPSPPPRSSSAEERLPCACRRWSTIWPPDAPSRPVRRRVAPRRLRRGAKVAPVSAAPRALSGAGRPRHRTLPYRHTERFGTRWRELDGTDPGAQSGGSPGGEACDSFRPRCRLFLPRRRPAGPA